MPCLIVTAGPGDYVGKCYKLGKRTLAGGRDPAREIQIPDPMVSRKHFLIRAEGEVHRIVELKAKNGIYVNGTRITEKELTDGDQIQVGDTILTYCIDDQADRTNALNQHRRADREMREDMTQMPEKK